GPVAQAQCARTWTAAWTRALCGETLHRPACPVFRTCFPVSWFLRLQLAAAEALLVRLTARRAQLAPPCLPALLQDELPADDLSQPASAAGSPQVRGESLLLLFLFLSPPGQGAQCGQSIRGLKLASPRRHATGDRGIS